jgi:hypothetical protein
MPDAIQSRWQRLSELLDQALGFTGSADLARWLAALEQQDPDMAAQASRILASRAHEAYANFLAAPLTFPG